MKQGCQVWRKATFLLPVANQENHCGTESAEGGFIQDIEIIRLRTSYLIIYI